MNEKRTSYPSDVTGGALPSGQSVDYYAGTVKAKYDVVILGACHNGLVAAAYLGRAELSVLLLEKNDYIGGATTSQRLFRDYDAQLSRYAYLASLLPEKIIRELRLNLELRTRAIASFTPYLRNGVPGACLLGNHSEEAGRASLRAHTGGDLEFDRLRDFYRLSQTFAGQVWDTMLNPLPAKDELRRASRTTNCVARPGAVWSRSCWGASSIIGVK